MKKLNTELLNAVYTQNQGKILELLKKGIDINSLDEDGRSILMHALLASDASLGIVKLLIQNGADVNLREPKQQWTALHFAAREGRAEIVKLLLDNKSEVDARDSFGNTPLWRAVMDFRGDDKVIRLLLSHGADKNLANKHGVSPESLTQTIAYPGIADVLKE